MFIVDSDESGLQRDARFELEGMTALLTHERAHSAELKLELQKTHAAVGDANIRLDAETVKRKQQEYVQLAIT